MMCVLFGHAPGSNIERLKEQMRNPGFECRRCGSIVMWKDMPRAVRRMRDEWLSRHISGVERQTSNLNVAGSNPAACSNFTDNKNH